MVTRFSPPINVSSYENVTMKVQLILEYGTCRMIEMNLQMNSSVSQNGHLTDGSTSEQLELTKYVTH